MRILFYVFYTKIQPTRSDDYYVKLLSVSRTRKEKEKEKSKYILMLKHFFVGLGDNMNQPNSKITDTYSLFYIYKFKEIN